MFRLILAAALTLGLVSVKALADDGGAQKLYDAKCAKCHGADGKGVEKMAKMFKVELSKLDLTGKETAKATDADLSKAITDGRKKMPKFKDKLKAAEIDSLVKYIRSLAPTKK